MRDRFGGLGPAVLAALVGALLPPRGASAQPQPPPATFALPTLDPAPAGDRFFAVPDAQVHGFIDLHFALYGGYAHRPLRSAGAPSTDYVDGQVLLNADVTAALAELVLLNLDLPVAVNTTSAVESGLGDLRLTLRLTPLSLGDELSLGLQGDIFFPTGSGAALAGDGYMRGHPRLLLGGRTRYLAYSAGAGYLFRKHEDLGNQVIGGSVSYGVAAAALLAQDSIQLGPELFGLVPTAQQEAESPRHAAALEVLLGVKIRLGSLVLGTAAGVGLTEAAGVPEARAVASVAYVPDLRVLDRDGDRLNDVADACPTEPGLTANGCPAPDRDGDSVADADDACPDAPGLVHAEESQHGCPPAEPIPAAGPMRPF